MRKPHLEGVIEKETEKMITKLISIGIGQSDWNWLKMWLYNYGSNTISLF